MWTSTKFLTCTLLVGIGLAHAGEWERMPGGAVDIGIGAAGSVWVTGTDGSPLHGGKIYQWKGSSWSAVEGFGSQIAVDPQGNPWVINKGAQVFRFTDGKFHHIPGGAADIAIGSDGTVWIVGIKRVIPGKPDHEVFRRIGDEWVRVPGGAQRIAVDPSGNAWITRNSSPGVMRYNGRAFEAVPGIKFPDRRPPIDIGIGPDGTVWIVGPDASIFRWTGSGLHKASGYGYKIAVGPSGIPWTANNRREIYRWVGPPPTKDKR